MSTKIVVGTQWGDEGKGKIIDMLSKESDVVARAQGGANAGHTVIIGDKKFILHMIPSGILHKGTINYIGDGVVFDYISFLDEMKMLHDNGVETKGKLFVSPYANVVMQYHRQFDRAQEEKRTVKIGTTSKGIGPAYKDKISRTGFRICDILRTEVFRETLKNRLDIINNEYEKIFGEKNKFSFDEIFEDVTSKFEIIREYVKESSIELNKAIKEGKKVLFEGAQGTLLDIDYGTYPFVTSSNTTAGGICTGTGVGPTYIDEVVGVLKAYTTRVGNGPFVTEFKDDEGEYLGNKGGEFGATTGRKRRCGAFDSLIAKYAVRINGLTSFALTKLDVLDELKEIKVCTGYDFNGEVLDEFISDSYILERCKPIYTTLPGWETNISGIKNYNDLPENTKKYIKFIENETGVPVKIISVGPDRDQTIFR